MAVPLCGQVREEVRFVSSADGGIPLVSRCERGASARRRSLLKRMAPNAIPRMVQFAVARAKGEGRTVVRPISMRARYGLGVPQQINWYPLAPRAMQQSPCEGPLVVRISPLLFGNSLSLAHSSNPPSGHRVSLTSMTRWRARNSIQPNLCDEDSGRPAAPWKRVAWTAIM